jgi:DNA-binding phage protein
MTSGTCRSLLAAALWAVPTGVGAASWIVAGRVAAIARKSNPAREANCRMLSESGSPKLRSFFIAALAAASLRM